jgi:acyl-homoserine-lactone acylase
MGVPHCYGETPAAMMYAHGYAQAEDHLEEMLILAVGMLGRAAEFFGPAYVSSDVGWRFLGGRREIEAHVDEIEGESVEIAAAFAAGVNAYRRTHPGEAAWASGLALDAIDVLAGVRAGTLDNQLALVVEKLGRIGQTTCPPGGDTPDDASNMWAIVPALSASGVTQIQADPHLPFDDAGTGGTHWYDVHLKSGPYDVIGAGRFGFPAMAIGSNRNLGWSSTNNSADNADVYEITLRDDAQRPGEFEYLHDGQWKDIEHVGDELIKVNGGPNITAAVRRTHHGVVAYPVPLSAGTAWAARISGQDVFNQLQQHLEMNRARNRADFKAAMEQMNLAFRNYMVATREGDIYTISYSRHPNRPPGICFGLPLDGTTSSTDWVKVGGSVLIPFEYLPQIENPTCGWMQNSNNAPWYNSCGLTPGDFQCAPGLCNPAAREGYRSQVASDYFEAKVAAGQTVSDAEMEALSLNTEVRSADAFIPLLDNAYTAYPPSDPSGHYAAVKAALDAWNRRADRNETGITIYTDWVIDFTNATGVSLDNPPASLTPAQQQAAVQALTSTVDELVADYGTPLVPYGDIHTIKRSQEVDDPFAVPPVPRPIGGGFKSLQTLRMASPGEDPTLHGRGNVQSGSSYMMLSTFDASGLVSARRIKPYGNSMHPMSPHYSDMTDHYSLDDYVPFPYTDAEVDADMASYTSFAYVPVLESRIPGSRRTDVTCAVEWTVAHATNTPYRDKMGFTNSKQTCTDGDPACDYDGSADGQCTFRLSVCLNNNDSRLPLCTPGDVSTFELQKPRPDSLRAWEAAAAVVVLDAVRTLAPGNVTTGGRHQNLLTFNPVVTASDSCSAAFDLVVPLKNSSRKDTLRLRSGAKGSTYKNHNDNLLLTCRP